MVNFKWEKDIRNLFVIVLVYYDDPVILVGTHANASATTWRWCRRRWRSMKERASAEQSIVIEWCPEAVVALQHQVSMVNSREEVTQSHIK